MLAENYKIVPVFFDETDFGASTDTDSIDMSGFHKATFIFNFGTVTTNVTITPKSGISEGTSTNAVPSQYAAGGAIIGTAVAGSTASCDVLAAWTSTDTTVSLAAATNKFLVIEIDASAMTQGDDWLTLAVAATSGKGSGVAILTPRYSGNRSATCLK